MKVSLKEAVTVGAVAAAALGLKILIEDPINYDKLVGPIQEKMERGLTDRDFQLLPPTDRRTLTAFRDRCSISIGQSRPEGGEDAIFREIYGATGPMSFWYRGEIYAARPGARALIDRYFERIKLTVGFTPLVHPIYHMVTSGVCDRQVLKSLALDDVQR
ncbi:hypothetical protein EYW49_21180 [Siculibacillus lacustris]|uniref:Uncharacterized protein n=1 Tax=Siculibacillus lacustris TaxID=1549641 RepID=A0A4V2KSI5_9HYPH|nr:hypothetical protein [Siculibacillus lacustris]TBW32967.1 hypothetical protein EYW49_21180 [Siculibacillus lacustris]